MLILGYFALAAIVIVTIFILYMNIISRSKRTNNYKTQNTPSGFWAKNKPYLIYEVPLIIVVMVYYFLDDSSDISDPTGSGVISKESSSSYTLDSILSLDWIPFQLSKYLSIYFNETSVKMILWTLVVLAVIWIVKTIYRAVKKQSPVIAFGYSGGWFIFLVSALVFYIFISEAFPEDKNNGSKAISSEPEYIDLRKKVNRVDTSDVRFINIHQPVKLHLPDLRRTDGIVAAGCVEVIDPKSLVSVLPDQHFVYVSGKNLYVKTLKMSDEAKEAAFNEQRNIVQIKVTLVEAMVGQKDKDICPHSY